MVKLVLLFISFFIFPTFVNSGSHQVSSVYGLRSSGWVEIKRSEFAQRLDGKGRYRDLKRVLTTTEYIFSKGGDIVKCLLSYDSQLDKIQEECQSIKN